MALQKWSISRINSDRQLYPIYTAEKFRQENRRCPDTNGFIKVEVDTIPSFQLALSTPTTFELRVYDYSNNSLQQTVTNATLQNYVYESDETLNDYLIISSTFMSTDLSSIPVGTYYIQIDADGSTYHGEVFEVVETLANQPNDCRWIKFNWQLNCKEFQNEFFSSNAEGKEVFVDTLYLPYTSWEERTVYEYESEGISDGLGKFEPDFRRQIKRIVLRIPIPRYALGAMEFMQLADLAEFTDNIHLVSYQMTNIEIDGDDNFDQSCWQIFEISFELDGNRGRSIYNATACCDDDIYSGDALNDLVNNECEVFVRGGCDFTVVLDREDADGDPGALADDELFLRAEVYDSNGDPYVCGTPSYEWYYADNTDCECEELTSETGERIQIKDDNAMTPYDNKGKYICIVTCGGCSMSGYYDYQANCRGGSSVYDPDNPECDEFAVAIDYDATNQQLTANPSDVPVGETVSYRWYYTDQSGNTSELSETAATISISNSYGSYEVIATAGNCVTSTIFTYTDSCLGFVATKVVDGDGINYTPPSGFSPTYDWIYIDTNGNRSSLGNSTTSHVAQNTGYYEFTMTDGDCTWINLTYMVISDCTGKTVTINVSGDNLTAVPTGFTTPTYAWYLDTGSGFQSLSATDDTYTATQTGAYKVEVTEGACTVEDLQVMIIDQGCDASATIAKNGAVLEVTVSNCTGNVTTKWYYWEQTNFTFVGQGLTHTPSSQGVYKAEIECEDCSELIILFIDDEGN